MRSGGQSPVVAARRASWRTTMPLYEYRCQECENRFERIEKPSSPHDSICPSCGGSARRLLGAPALQFKGSGWYVTDYGKGNGKTAATSASAADSSDSKPEKKSESPATKDAKPAATSSSKDSKVA
jgi:putative FmdB family regulatory protein